MTIGITRRAILGAPLAGVAQGLVAQDLQSPKWTAKWDAAVLTIAVAQLDGRFDARESMLRQKLSAEYHYHTNLRDQEVHPTRESLDYALLLLESKDKERGEKIIERVVKLQDSDPKSLWYGLWGYYLEEPASKMSPADWNWADFLGATLLTIEFRHGAKLDAAVRSAVREAIRHAASSVRKRNVAMTYTNIAVQGTFVTLAAAEVLGDADLKQYAQDRLVRFARTVDETGSFAEYNSPTYANVTIANLTRIRMYVKDEASRKLAGRIEQRAWNHLSRHWHSPTLQLAGPMSRCYQTDIGQPAWIQKATNGGVAVMTFDEIKLAGVPGDVALIDYHCPDSAIGWFLTLGYERDHIELFANAPSDVRPLQGTTCLALEYCLGSVNRGTFWIQSRPLLAYWGGSMRPARYLQARLMKDDYDFASGLLYCTQVSNYVLGVATFRSPGGDKHPSLDPVKDGQFTCSRLRLRFDLAGVPFNAPILVNGKAADEGVHPPGSRVLIDVGGTYLWLRVLGAQFGDTAGKVSIARESGLLTLSIDLVNSEKEQVVRWPESAFVAFALTMLGSDAASPEEQDRKFTEDAPSLKLDAGVASLSWKTKVGVLGMEASTKVGAVGEMDRAFKEMLNGKPVPIERLHGDRLV